MQKLNTECAKKQEIDTIVFSEFYLLDVSEQQRMQKLNTECAKKQEIDTIVFSSDIFIIYGSFAKPRKLSRLERLSSAQRGTISTPRNI